MKLEPPAKFDGRAASSASGWLIEMARWLKLSRIPQGDLWDVIATRMTGGAATWNNAKLRDAELSGGEPWADWNGFKRELLAQFESLSKEERAREQLRNLSQTGSVHTYVYRFTALRSDVPSMNIAEAFSLFMKGLQPQLKQLVGSLIRTDDLEGAIELVKKATKYGAVDKPAKDAGAGKDQKEIKRNKKGQVHAVSGEDKAQQELMAVQKNRLKQLKDEADKQAQKNKQLKEEAKKLKEQKMPKTCLYCGQKGHFVQQCPKIKDLEKKASTSGNASNSGN